MTSFRPQLAVALKDSHKLKFPCIIEPKIDGVRCVCIIKDHVPTFWSREGKPFVNFEELEQELLSYKLPDMILDGEIMAQSGNFDDTISRTRSHRGVNTHIPYRYVLFDILINPEPLGTIYILLSRKDHLDKFFKDYIVGKPDSLIWRTEHCLCESEDEMFKLNDKFCREGYEGSMLKPLGSIYHQGRNQDWKKLKPFYSADLRITGMSEGTGKCAGMMGRIVVEGRVEDMEAIQEGCDPCEAFIRVKCEVGTGFSDELRKEMWLNQLDYIGQYVEIQYQEVTKDNSLRFPSFKRFRGDKN